MRLLRTLPAALTAALIVLVAGCGDILRPSHAEVHSVILDPSVSTLEQGDEVQLQATARSADGTALSGRQIFWASEDTLVARISATGLLQGISVGTTRVAASSEGRHALISVAVRPAAVAGVTVSPSAVVVASRGSASLRAALVDARSRPLQGRDVQWTSRAPEVVGVEADGTVRALRAGTTHVVATAEGKSDSAQVTVQSGPPRRARADAGDGQTGTVGRPLPVLLAVRVLDEFDDPVGGVEVQWAVGTGGGSVAPAVSRTDASGRATATWTLGQVPGQHTATARAGSLSATFGARAAAGAVRVLQATPDSVHLGSLRDTVRLNAAARDEHGNVVPGVTPQWQSLTPSVAAVNQNGRVESVGNGRALVVASAGGVADTVVVRVRQQVARVVVGPRQARINALGFSRTLAAEARDANGHRVVDATVTWSTLEGAVAAVSTAGVVTARARGTARIRAIAGGRADTAVVEVHQVVATVRSTPAVDTVLNLQSTQLTAQAADSAGVAIPDAAVRWSSSDPTVASVDERGRVRALSPGTARITATSQGIRGTSTVVVRAIPVHRVTVEPGQHNLSRGQSHQFVATAFAADGRRLSDRRVVWSSSAPAVVTVNATGVITAVSAGKAEIKATVEGVSASARVNVNNGKNQ